MSNISPADVKDYTTVGVRHIGMIFSEQTSHLPMCLAPTDLIYPLDNRSKISYNWIKI
jgi:hypothetical protein